DRGLREIAAERYARVLNVHPQHSWALGAMAQLELDAGNLEAACAAALALDPLDPHAGIAARTGMFAAAALGDPARAAEAGRRIAACGLLTAGERAIYAAWAHLVQGPRDGVHAFVPHDPDAAEVLFGNLEALARL